MVRCREASEGEFDPEMLKRARKQASNTRYAMASLSATTTYGSMLR